MIREFARPYIIVDDATTGTVMNVAMFDSYEDANRVARLAYNENAFAEEYKWLVAAGDTYHDGKFWNKMPADDTHEEEWEQEAEYIPSDEENIQTLQSAQEEQTLAMAEVYALTSTMMASLEGGK